MAEQNTRTWRVSTIPTSAPEHRRATELNDAPRARSSCGAVEHVLAPGMSDTVQKMTPVRRGYHDGPRVSSAAQEYYCVLSHVQKHWERVHQCE